jgi:hypothetical protein
MKAAYLSIQKINVISRCYFGFSSEINFYGPSGGNPHLSTAYAGSALGWPSNAEFQTARAGDLSLLSFLLGSTAEFSQGR